MVVFNRIARVRARATTLFTLALASTTWGTAIAAPMPAQAATGASVAAAPAQDANQVAAQTGAFADVPESSWAYSAVQQLASEGYIKGYLDGQYKGNRPMTRYEVAVLVARADTAIRNAIANGGSVKPADIAALKKLLTEFASEIQDVKSRVGALETKQAALQKSQDDLKKEADASALAINRAHFADNMGWRPGASSTQFNVRNGPSIVAGNAPHAFLRSNGSTSASRGTGYSWGAGSLNTTPVGNFGGGSMYWFNRVTLLGTLARGWSYGFRLTTGGIHQLNANGTTTGTGFCTGTTGVAAANCSYDNLNTGSSIPIIMEFGYTQWTSPGGMYATVGRFPTGEGNYFVNPNTLFFSGQSITGATTGYRSPDGNVQAQVIYGLSGVGATTLAAVNAASPVCAANVIGLNRGTNTQFQNFNPNCNETQSEIGSSIQFRFPDKRTVMLVGEDSFKQKTIPLWDPAAVSCAVGAATFSAVNPARCISNGGRVTTANGGAGNYFTGQANVAAGELELGEFLGPKSRPTFFLAGSVASRFGNDPFTGTGWVGRNAYVGSITYASKGNIAFRSPNPLIPGTGSANSNVLQFAFHSYGANSLFGIDAGPSSGTPVATNNLGLSNFNGLNLFVFQYAHWFTPNIRVGLIGIHAQSMPNTGLPIGANGLGGVNPCPGCSGFLNLNQVDLETFLVL